MSFLNFGCGPILPGRPWVNVDRSRFGQGLVADAAVDGLPFDDGTFTGVVASHSLQENSYAELPQVLTELHRVLRSGGVLRTLSPNVLAAVGAYWRGDIDWFPVGADEPTLDGKLCTYINWFGTARCLFTPDRMIELLTTAGFVDVEPVQWGASRCPGLADLDDRVAEHQVIVEGTRP